MEEAISNGRDLGRRDQPEGPAPQPLNSQPDTTALPRAIVHVFIHSPDQLFRVQENSSLSPADCWRADCLLTDVTDPAANKPTELVNG